MKRMKLVQPWLLLALVVAAIMALLAPAAASADIADEFGIEAFSARPLDLLSTSPEELKEDTQAGSHPDVFVVNLKVNNHLDGNYGFVQPDAQLKDVRVELPPGLVGNGEATQKCRLTDLIHSACPSDTVVGFHEGSYFVAAVGFGLEWTDPVYNLVPPAGVAARFGMKVLGTQMVLFDMSLNSDGRYTLNTNVDNIPQSLEVVSSRLNLFGVPGAMNGSGSWKIGLGGRGVGVPIPMLTLPSTCGAQNPVKISVNSWQRPEAWHPASYASTEELSGCEKLIFSPTVRMQPESSAAGAPSGYSFELQVPQNEAPNGLGTPPLKETVVSLPKGVTLSPAVAEGAVGCTDEQAALHSLAEASCPEASRIGSVEIQTPILAGPLKGSVYVGQPKSSDSQSGEMFRLFFVASGYGVTIKQEGRIVPDPTTGQLRAVFTDSPQQPFSLLKLDFKGGPRAVLTNPSTCGTYTTTANLTPWSAPASGPPAVVSDSFAIDQGCGTAGEFAPGLEAGTANPVAGSYSPFTLRVTRGDGEQNIASIGASLPPGLLAKLAGVPLCPDAAAATGACPAASQVGTTTVAAGDGSHPIYIPQPGKAPTGVYLAGPYKGAPYSLVVEVPAQAGPFDLGTVAVRNALHIDPVTTQVTASSDQLPQILQGVPVSYRDVRVEINRPEFTLNPTSCDPMSIGSTIASAGGAVAHPSIRFQVGDCGSLEFKPKVALRLSGAPPRRGANPALRATVTPASGDANIGKASVILPGTELLEQGHIKTVCTRVQFAANQCPAGSIYGYAKAWTPLLDQPLEGPVYLRSNGGERKLPDLVADLGGQIHVVLVGYIDSVKRHGSPRIRTRFVSVPDAPVSRFVLDMQRGKKSLLANTTNLCKAKARAEASLTGQNGRKDETRPLVKVEGCGGKQSKAHKKSGAHKR